MILRLFFFLFLLSFNNILISQNDEPIIDSAYKFRNTNSVCFKNLPHGIYKFNTDIEYISFMSQHNTDGLFHPIFFNGEEMGLVINYQSYSIGSGKEVYAVFETTNYIVIQLRPYSSYMQFAAMNEQQLCVALKKSKKEMIIQEIQ